MYRIKYLWKISLKVWVFCLELNRKQQSGMYFSSMHLSYFLQYPAPQQKPLLSMISSSFATRLELIFLMLVKETLHLATQGGILNVFLSNSMFYHHKSNIYSYWSTGEKIYAEYTMRNAGLDETQAGIKIAGRNINNLR